MPENLPNSERMMSRARERWIPWTCPECADRCENPTTDRLAVCHRGHMVDLKTNRAGGFDVRVEMG